MNKFEKLLCRNNDMQILCVLMLRRLRDLRMRDCRAYLRFLCFPKCEEKEDFADENCIDTCTEELYPYVCEGKFTELLRSDRYG